MSNTIRVSKVRVERVQFHPHNIRRDLGDLRPLAHSIKRFGLMQPIIVEEYGDKYRLRAGHRRVAACRLAGVGMAPALIHDVVLDDDEWLIQSVQENVHRRTLDTEERARAVIALREHGCTWEGIADVFACSIKTVRGWLEEAERGTIPLGKTPTEERMDFAAAQVAELSRQGRTNSQIADQLHMTQRRVERLRERAGLVVKQPNHPNKHKCYVVGKRELAQVCQAWREVPDATVNDLADAIQSLIDGIGDPMPPSQPRLKEAV